MAESTTTRFGLQQWSASTDTPERLEFDSSFGALEANAAGWLPSSTAAARPAAAAANARFLHRASDSGQLSYSTGSVWIDIPSDGDVAAEVTSALTTHAAAGDPHAGYQLEAEHTKELHDALGIDHGSLSDRGHDDHLQYARVDGARGFSSPVPGITPTDPVHLTTKEYVDARVPVGVVTFHASAVIPNGWLLCDGAAISRNAHATLFGIIGTTYGSGDGSTTFNLPDMRQRFPLGRAASGTGSVLGSTGGAFDHRHSNPTTSSTGSHTHTNPNVNSGGSHSHSVSGTTGPAGDHMHSSSSTSYPGQGDGFDSLASNPDYRTSTDGSHSHSFSDTTSSSGTSHAHTQGITGPAGGHDHTQANTGPANPPYLVLNPIIRAL